MAVWMTLARKIKLGTKRPNIPSPVGGVVNDGELRAAVDAVRQALIDLELMEPS